jgi:predicted GIY-YIG superfamily endonuclease
MTMTHKIYLIKHLDTGMGYVGITSRDLLARWKQHHSDTHSALYEVLRTDSHRMTMELLEEFEDRDQALKAEQQYIRKLETAQPNGWNRQVTHFYEGNRGWKPYFVPIRYEPNNYDTYFVPPTVHSFDVSKFILESPTPQNGTIVCCPVCGKNRLSMYGRPDIRRRSFTCFFVCHYCHRNSFRDIKGPRGGFGQTICIDPKPYELTINMDCQSGDFRIGMLVTKKDDES